MSFFQYIRKVSPLPLIFLVFIGLFSLMNLSTFWKSFPEDTEEASLQAVFQETELEYNNLFQGKEVFVDLNGALSRLFASRELNGVVRLDNGTFLSMEEEMDTGPLVENVVDFFGKVEALGYPAMYIQAPSVPLADDDPQIPTGYVTYLNRNMDVFLKGMEASGLLPYDLRKTMEAEGLDPYEAFFKTDHHWTPETAHWAHSKIGGWIDQRLGIEVLNPDYFDLSLFQIETHQEVFLGSHGKRTGPHFTGYDDLSIITPLFHTELQVEIPSLALDVSGSFEEVFFSSPPPEEYNYSMYLHGDQEYTKITNHLAENQVKLLFIKDSFTLPVACFLALHYQEIHLIDLRYDKSLDDILEMIQEIQPDLVVEQFASIKLLN